MSHSENSSSVTPRSGPLSGLRVLFLGGIGPAPYGAMLLADLGADVVRIDRSPPSPDKVTAAGAGDPFPMPVDPFSRGQRSIALNLRNAEDAEIAWKLIEKSDVLVEGFRPGVLERLGFAPDVCHQRNPALVIARVTGWGQQGPLAQTPGHDINYIALTGALDAIGRQGQAPSIPLNLIGDFAGGGLWMAFGVMAALFERARSGRGQVVDAAMVDGSMSLLNMAYAMKHFGLMPRARGENLLDGGAHLYDSYECADGGRVAVGAIEPEFYAAMCEGTGLVDDAPDRRLDPARWPTLKADLDALFRERSRDEWCAEMEKGAACLTPVLGLAEAPHHEHHVARGSFVEVEGVTMPAPGPRFSRTPPDLPSHFARPGADSSAIRASLSSTETRSSHD